ncbi:gamma-glutamyl kinase [Donghicola sp. XS_ASV15]|uniref:gamma-glutamyl kinase n=1 Tax=Donghicola sp. XS_ASV15 TaxID=3241295 RepID=UPI0035198332
MLVFWKQNLAILSVPKTGTTALEAALSPHADIVISNPPELKHLPVYRYTRFMEKMFDKATGRTPETVAVVREPIDWLGSWYRYRQRPELQGRPNSTSDVAFDDFVLEYTKGKPAPFANVGSQARFLAGEEGRICGVTHLFRYNRLDKLYDFLQDRLGREITTERMNVSPAGQLTLSAEVAEHLRRKCPQEFELYDSVK